MLHAQSWFVYAKPPFGGPARVLAYLARYTHRVAITNARLVDLADGVVRFRWKDYADHDRTKVMALSADEFLRRFLLHVLPTGFVRIRHAGLFANRGRHARLDRCRARLRVPPRVSAPTASASTAAPISDRDRCPTCHQGIMRITVVFAPVRDARLRSAPQSPMTRHTCVPHAGRIPRPAADAYANPVYPAQSPARLDAPVELTGLSTLHPRSSPATPVPHSRTAWRKKPAHPDAAGLTIPRAARPPRFSSTGLIRALSWRPRTRTGHAHG